MPAIKVSRKIALDPERAEINKLRNEWTGERRQLDTDIVGMCTMPGCRTMPFVSLKTTQGRRPLCLRHFEKLRLDEV